MFTYQRQLILIPTTIIAMLVFLVWFTLDLQQNIQTQNEHIRTWSSQIDQIYIGQRAALRMRQILKKTDQPKQDVEDLHLNYMEQYLILTESLKCDACLAQLNVDKRQRVESLAKSLNYKEDIHIASYLPLLNELIPTLEHFYKSMVAQKRASYIDYYRAVAAVGPKVTWISLSVLITCTFLALWQIFFTMRGMKHRIFVLNQQANDLATGRLCITPKTNPTKDQFDQLENKLFHIAQQLTEQSSLDSIFSVSEEERKRLAMEIHDQTLTELNMINRQLEQCNQNSENKKIIADMQNNLQQLAQNLRRIIDDLHPTSLTLVGLEQTIEAFLSKLKHQGGPDYYLKIEPKMLDSMSEKQILHLYRIIIESISNAIRHGGCKNLEITLRKNLHGSILTIEDDGVGFDQATTIKGRGMMNIRSRAQILDGTVSWSHSRFNQGTCVTLKMPKP